MLTASQRATIFPPSPPSQPRLCLAPARGQAVLDGGWWPRSWDPVAELPGLVLALSERHGRIRHIMLNMRTWDSRCRRLAVGPDVVRIGWFGSLDPALLIATTSRDEQLDLLIVPPATTPAAAERALATAAAGTNLRHARDILSTGSAPVDATAATSSDAYAVWDSEGGSAAADGARRSHAGPTVHARTEVPG